MKTIVIAGVTFFIGMLGASVAVFAWHNNHPIVCTCTQMGGDSGKWTGDQCPDEWRQRLFNQYHGICPK